MRTKIVEQPDGGWTGADRARPGRTVAQLVRGAREARGLTVAAAAERAGIAKAYLSMIENRKVGPPSAKVLTGLAKALGLDEDNLAAAAAWEAAPAVVRDTVARQAEAVEQAHDLARWLRAATSRKAGGGRNLDRLFRSGELRKRVAATLGDAGGEGERDGARDGDAGATTQAWPEARGVVGRLAHGHMPAGTPHHYPLTTHALHLPGAGGLPGVPIINKVAAGYPADFTDLGYPAGIADDTIVCPDVHDPDAFAARVVGESMAPDYREGDVVVFSPLADVVDGCDCYARLEPDHEATFKRVFFERDDGGDEPTRIRLVPLNPKYPVKTYPREQVAGLYRAVWSLRRV